MLSFNILLILDKFNGYIFIKNNTYTNVMYIQVGNIYY